MKPNIKAKEATAIINSLIGGVVPKIGVQHITVGRSKEIEMLLATLKEVKNGQSLMKCWIGDFGSGKSFMLHLLNTVALKQKFVVTQTDFTPHIRLYSNDGKGQALYAALMDNLAILTKPEGGALSVLLEKWIEQVMMNTARKHGLALTEIRQPEHFPLIQNEIMQTLNDITETGAFDFGLAVIRYYEGFIRNDDNLRKNALRWLKGEYATKTEARNDLGVSEIINDRNYYDMLKNFCRLFVSIGYNGLIINLDEAINLHNIVNPGMRQRNYETLLSIYNDCFQGKTAHLFVNIAGTTDVLEHPQKGFYSYDALKTRLKINQFETSELRDYAQPVIRLMPLTHNEIFVLLQNLKEIFDFNYQVEIDFPEKDIRIFMEEIFNRPEAGEHLTPREVIRDFLNILNILRQNPEAEKGKLLQEICFTQKVNTGPKEEEKEETPQNIQNVIPEEPLERKTITAELKYWERKIADKSLKKRLHHTGRIVGIIEEKYPNDSELFFLRHVDTLAKLLKQFHSLESSAIDSPEINAAKKRIAETIDAAQKAFEQELKNRFQTDMLDIDAESAAYLQGFKNKGLIE